jgi:hypothetical protein
MIKIRNGHLVKTNPIFNQMTEDGRRMTAKMEGNYDMQPTSDKKVLTGIRRAIIS